MDNVDKAVDIMLEMRRRKHEHPFNVQTLQNMGPYEVYNVLKMKGHSCSSILEGVQGAGVQFSQRTKANITIDDVKAITNLIKEML